MKKSRDKTLESDIDTILGLFDKYETKQHALTFIQMTLEGMKLLPTCVLGSYLPLHQMCIELMQV